MPLNLISYARQLSVTPQGGMIITTRAGEVAFTDSMDGYWHKISPREKHVSGLGPGFTLGQSNFFNNDTGFISGFINNGKGKYSIIYHTQNSGRSWQAIDFGVDGWVDDACHLDNGEAWLSVGGKGIVYTADYGFTWKHVSNPEHRQRFTSIYFNTKREGLIGSLWNTLALTLDNCNNWKIIPTPLDQKKYNKTNRQSRPGIDRTAIFGNYLLVSQEGLIFYSRRDSINWIGLEYYVDFFTDPANSALFFKRDDNSYVKADSTLQPVFRSALKEQSYGATCRSGHLYIQTADKVLLLGPGNTVNSSFIHTDKDAEVEPEHVGYTKDGTAWGAIENSLYVQRTYGGNWEYALTLPFRTDSGRLAIDPEGKILYYKENDSLYYYTAATDRVEKKYLPTMVRTFWDSGIKQLRFSTGSQGCSHHYNDELVYDHTTGGFELVDQRSGGSPHKEKLTTDITTIDEKEIAAFVKKMPDYYRQKATITDLEFTEDDYARCKKDILAFKENLEKPGKRQREGRFYFNRNNLDFDRLLLTVDSIKHLDDTTLWRALVNIEERTSTTTNWVSVIFVNNNNEQLIISNSSSAANALYLPWLINVNGATTVTFSMAITRFIRQTCPDLLKERDKAKVLHTFVRQLYN